MNTLTYNFRNVSVTVAMAIFMMMALMIVTAMPTHAGGWGGYGGGYGINHSFVGSITCPIVGLFCPMRVSHNPPHYNPHYTTQPVVSGPSQSIDNTVHVDGGRGPTNVVTTNIQNQGNNNTIIVNNNTAYPRGKTWGW